jgi:hypothetical protein
MTGPPNNIGDCKKIWVIFFRANFGLPALITVLLFMKKYHVAGVRAPAAINGNPWGLIQPF